jgi:alpha-amylase
VKKQQYWRLKDADGKPTGLMGWWPSKAVTFLDNHDTGAALHQSC